MPYYTFLDEKDTPKNMYQAITTYGVHPIATWKTF